MTISKSILGSLCGKPIYKITLSNGIIDLALTNYGATVMSLYVPDKFGNKINVVAGFDTIEEYVANTAKIGATVGRVAGRIENGKFKIGEKEYNTTINQKGNTLHGGVEGFDKKVWDLVEYSSTARKVAFSYISPDGEEGFPSTLNVKAIYTLTDDNSLRIEYEAFSDGDTIVSLMNHSYFNLDGEGNVFKTKLSINSHTITPPNESGVIDGRLLNVKNTVYDFTLEREFGDVSKTIFPLGNTYDVNYLFDNNYKKIVSAKSEKSGIVMDAYSNADGMQLYVPVRLKGKYVNHPNYSFFCLETQRVPNAINCDNLPSPIIKKGEKYYSRTEYQFSCFNNV